MTHKVFTKEIAEALELEPVEFTHELMFEREQAIEKRWLQEFRKLEESISSRVEQRVKNKAAQAKIGQSAQSALHNKGVVIPHIFKPQSIEVDDEAVTQIIDVTMQYITMGRDFEILLQAIKENPMLESEWDRFMVALRMVTE